MLESVLEENTQTGLLMRCRSGCYLLLWAACSSSWARRLSFSVCSCCCCLLAMSSSSCKEAHCGLEVLSNLAVGVQCTVLTFMI